MFGSTLTSSRGVLLPSKALKLFNLYMEDTRRIDNDHAILMELCLDADFALSRIGRSERKNLASSGSIEDKMLYQSIGSAHYEVARLFERLGRSNDAKKSDIKAEKWGYVPGSSNICQQPSRFGSFTNNNNNNNNINAKQESGGNSISKLKEMNKATKFETTHSIAVIPSDIFDRDVTQATFKCNLPDPDTPLNNTQQLAYCLTLLSTAQQPLKDLTAQEQEWSSATSKDQDENARLYNLASDVIAVFIEDDIKTEAAVAEVVMLAPVLKHEQYRKVLMTLVNGISQNIMLATYLLEGLAQLIQHASPGYLDSDDLVNILNTLNSRLQGTHMESSSHIYRLCVTVSHVLDAMINNQVKGLKREQLHEPLAAYLKELKGSSDPHLVYHAAYAFQALLYIPNDESSMQAMLRRTSAVARGVFGLVSAVKELNLNDFMDELANIQNELHYVTDIVDKSLDVYKGAVSLYESGAAFKQDMEEGLSFNRKTAWYPALRGADALLQTGEFTKFKTLVCETSCRNDTAFQWGLCQRLGQIAANPQWDLKVRQDAIAFLGEMYKNDKDWGQHVKIKQWIVTILKGLTSLPIDGLQVVESLLHDLATDGDTNKQQLFSNCSQEAIRQYPFIVALPPPASPSLINRAQNRPDVEKSLRLLMRQRMANRDDKYFYIQQYAKASPQANDDDSFLLMDKVNEFLDSDQKVLLIQGDSGAGKSTFNHALEHTLWEAYQKNHDRIPLFINLPAIDDPSKDVVTKQLRMYDFTKEEIKELKMTRSFILICDGYDEAMQTNNLYFTNHLNQPGGWKCQMVISCRSEYLGNDYRSRFQPMNRNYQVNAELFQEAVIVPFSEAQIDDYIKQYVATMDILWGAEDYLRALKMVPSLRELVKNPFILLMTLEVLPRMVDPDQDISKTQIKRVTLYDQFVELWFERGKKRLGEISMPEDRKMFRILCDEGFAQNGILYLKELAVAVYKNQDGNPVVDYSPSKDRSTWKEEYFSRDSRNNLLREASPMSRTGGQYRFVHRSILEYCVVRAMFEPQKVTKMNAIDTEATAIPNSRRRSISSVFSFEAEESQAVEQAADPAEANETSPLVWRSFVNEPSILEFLKDRVGMEAKFKRQLYEYVELSKSDKQWRTAAANAMTILVRAGESFIEADLRGIQIPGADLSHGIFDGVQLQGADLRNVNLRSCWLHNADLNGAKMAGVQFGEWPLLHAGGKILQVSYSPDGQTLAAAVYDYDTDEYYVRIYNTLTWERCMNLGTEEYGQNFIYSPDSRHIAIWHKEKSAVLVFDATLGTVVHRFEGHTDVICSVAYSPNGDYLASASKDGSVHVWDARSGMTQYIIEAHASKVASLVYSPDGKQIATGGEDKAVRLWDAASGKLMLMLQVYSSQVLQIVYSPNGQEIITRYEARKSLDVWDARSGQKKWALEHKGDVDGVQYPPDGKYVASFSKNTAFQWDMQTREIIHTLTGTSSTINGLKYSPNGEQIATYGKTVRLWDARSGQLVNTFCAHFINVRGMAYPPNGSQAASFGEDGTIRLWDTQSQQSNHDQYGHTDIIRQVRFSPNGQHMASFSRDGTVRMWNVRTGQCIHVLQSRAKDIKYSPSGQLLVSIDPLVDPIYYWDTESSQIIQVLRSQHQSGGINAFDISLIGQQIACGHGKGNVTVWDARTGQLIHTLQGGRYLVRSVLFSPNGHQIASYDNNSRIRVWMVHSGELRYELEAMGLDKPYLVYSPDSQKIAFVQDYKKLQVRNAETGELCHETIFDGIPPQIAFSPSGRLVVVGSAKGPINMMDTETGTVLHTLEGHTNCTVSISYSCDGQYIASSSEDATVRLWDTESSRCLATIPIAAGYVHTLGWSISEEDYFLATGHGDGCIRMWQIVKSKDGQCHTRLKWSTKQTVLCATGASIRDVAGLSQANRKLLEQLEAVGDPTQCPTSQASNHETKAVPSTPSELGSDVLSTISKRSNSRAGLLIAKSEGIKEYQFICSKCNECNECDVAHFILCGSYDSIDSTDLHKVKSAHIDLIE